MEELPRAHTVDRLTMPSPALEKHTGVDSGTILRISMVQCLVVIADIRTRVEEDSDI